MMNVQNKKIGLFSAIVIQTNAMIGAGIVAIPAILAQTTGMIGLIPFVLCILIIFCMSVSLGELSLLHSGHAWCYRFPSILAGHRVGMKASVCYVFGVLIAMGFVAKQAGLWLHDMIPFLSVNQLSLIITVILTAFVYSGKNVSSFWQFFYSGIIFVGILVTSAVCFENFDKELFFESDHRSLISMLRITPILLFSFLGFESISSLYAIVKNPRKNVLLGGVIGILVVGTLYMIFSSSILGSINPTLFLRNGEASLATVLSQAFPKMQLLPKFIYFGGLFAIIGTLHSMIWSVSVLIMDVLQKSKNKRLITMLNEKKIPMNYAIVFSGAVIIISAFTLKSEEIMNGAVALIAISYVLSIMGLFKGKKSHFLHKLVCGIGVLGGCLMVYFALYAFVNGLTV